MSSWLIRDVLGSNSEEDFLDFDLSEIKKLSDALQYMDGIDLPQAEKLAQDCLRCADILCVYLAKLTKTTSYLESKLNSIKNKESLNYENPKGKTTADMRRFASETSPEVEEIQIKLAKAKGSKSLVEKKFDIAIKSHHHFKDIAGSLRKTILGYRDGV